MLDVITPAPEAYSYRRVSTPAQELGDGPRRQKSGAEEVAERYKLPLNTTVSLDDLGVSAFTGENMLEDSKLSGFLRLVKQGKIARGSLLIMDGLDRFSRDEPMRAIGPYTELLLAGINIYTVVDSRFHDHQLRGMESAMMLMVSLMQFAAGNEESFKKSFRLGEVWQEKRAEAVRTKKPLTSLTPGWLRLDKETMQFVVIGDRAKIIVAMFELAAAGVGKRTIARKFAHLERWGRGKRAGKTLYESYVGKLLNDRRVLGEYQPGTNPKKPRSAKGKREWRPSGDPIENFYPRIVSDELWWRVRHARELRRGAGGGNPDAFHSIFRGLTFCGHCSPTHRKPVGMQYVMKGKGTRSGTDKLVCSLALRKKCEHARRYDYERLEASVLTALGSSAAQLIGKENERRAEMQKEVDIVKTRLSGLKAQQQRWISAMEDVDVPPKTIVAKIAELDGELATFERELQTKLAELNATPVYQTGDRLKDLYAAMKARKTAEERRRLNQQLRGIIARIDFCPDPDGSGGSTVVISFVGGGNSAAKIFLP